MNGGEELFIGSRPRALKLKLRYKEGSASKTSPLLPKEEDDG